MHVNKKGFRPGFFAFGAHKELADDSTLEVNSEKVRIKDSGVTTAKINDSAVTEAKAGLATVAGITTGLIAAKVIATTQLEALLDTSTNNLFAVKAGDVILDVILTVGTAAGEAATVDIGLDAAAAVGSADPNGLLAAGNANAEGVYRGKDTVTDATAPTYQGDLLDDGPVHIAADGFVVIDSSADESSSSFVGQVTMLYIPA